MGCMLGILRVQKHTQVDVWTMVGQRKAIGRFTNALEHGLCVQSRMDAG